MLTQKYRSRVHALLLYPDDASHVEALKKIEQNYDYAYILHDCDVTEDGEVKKPHWHVVLRFKQAVWNTAICSEIGLETNYIEQVRKMDNALLYLIHFNDADKYQYNKNDVKGTLKKKIDELINSQDKSEGEKVSELIEYITSQDKRVTVTEFAQYCASNGYWAEFRRSGAIFCKILDEHNAMVGGEQ